MLTKNGGRVFVLSHYSHASFRSVINGRKVFTISTAYTLETRSFPKYMQQVIENPTLYGSKRREINEIFGEIKNSEYIAENGDKYTISVSADYTIKVILSVDDELYNQEKRKQCAKFAYKLLCRVRNEIREIYREAYTTLINSNKDKAIRSAKRGGVFSSISFLNASSSRYKNPAAVAT